MRAFTKKEEQILAAVLCLENNAYLISIREQIKSFTGRYYSVGTIYAPLNRLHVYGYLKTDKRPSEHETGGKAIQYYSLTKRGLKALAELKRQAESMWSRCLLPSLEK